MRTAKTALLPFVIVTLLAPAALAKSGQLWSEKDRASVPLAQVPDFTKLADQLVPAVVSIQVEQAARVSRSSPGTPGTPSRDPFDYFHRFFGDIPKMQPGRGIGSGFVIGKQGLILTNNHVVEGADNIEVTFANDDGSERTLTAEILGTAPEYDVALIQTKENANVKFAYLGDSDKVKIGDWVMAIGNPFGLSHSVSVGIVSAKDRRDIAPSGRRGLYDFLQTDASINPGNSGGPLINMRGEVIGINTAINAAGSGIGFAIPINMVKDILPDLKEKGSFTRSWIGIKIQEVSDELAESFRLNRSEGALVSEVVPNSPASNAGLKSEDIILEFDGKPVRVSNDLPLYASMAGVGKRVPLKVWRNGREKRMFVILEAFPTDEVALSPEAGEERGALGITVADITPTLQREFRIEQARGVVVKEIEPGGLAARKGLRVGDVLMTLNGRKVDTARDFAGTVRKIKSGGVLRLQVNRQGARLFLALRKP